MEGRALDGSEHIFKCPIHHLKKKKKSDFSHVHTVHQVDVRYVVEI